VTNHSSFIGTPFTNRKRIHQRFQRDVNRWHLTEGRRHTYLPKGAVTSTHWCLCHALTTFFLIFYIIEKQTYLCTNSKIKLKKTKRQMKTPFKWNFKNIWSWEYLNTFIVHLKKITTKLLDKKFFFCLKNYFSNFTIKKYTCIPMKRQKHPYCKAFILC